MKKNVKILVFAAIAVALLLCGCIIFIFYQEPKIAVINYHNIVSDEEIKSMTKEQKLWNISVSDFKKQMKHLKKWNYKTLKMDEFYKWKKKEIELPFKSVLITFDDGLVSQYKYALPILKEYNLNATIFVIGSFSEHTDQMEKDKSGNKYLSKEQIEKIRKEYPNVELHSHTYNIHRHIGDKQAVYCISEEEMEEDIRKYENFMGKTEFIAYPFGLTDERYVNKLKEHNFKSGFLLVDKKKATREDNDFYINRINSSGDSLLHFAIRLLLPY